ncbi:MAG: WavE lipopolysaccharide synthesis family protein, partial [Shewanella sp.]
MMLKIKSNIGSLSKSCLGLGLIKRFIPKSKRPNEMSYLDWLLLYKQYCDPNTQASRLELFRT